MNTNLYTNIRYVQGSNLLHVAQKANRLSTAGKRPSSFYTIATPGSLRSASNMSQLPFFSRRSIRDFHSRNDLL